MSIPDRRRHMAALLARRDREGLTYQELSEESGVPAGTLASWQWRLRREREATAFDELVVEEGVPERIGGHDLEIVGPLGHRLRFPADIAPDVLERIVRALPC